MTIGSGAWADRLDALLRDRRELFEAHGETLEDFLGRLGLLGYAARLHLCGNQPVCRAHPMILH